MFKTSKFFRIQTEKGERWEYWIEHISKVGQFSSLFFYINLKRERGLRITVTFIILYHPVPDMILSKKQVGGFSVKKSVNRASIFKFLRSPGIDSK